MARVHQFMYLAAPHELRGNRPSLHKLRDGGAMTRALGVLCSPPLSYEAGELIFNAPLERPKAPRSVELSLQPGDYLLLTTRPPMDDEEDDHARPIARSYTSLEAAVFLALRRLFFKHCSRVQMTLSDAAGAAVSQHGLKWAQRANVMFAMNARLTRKDLQAGFKDFQMAGDPAWTKATPNDGTAAYLATAPQAWAGGPRLVVLFGMGGIDTLVWAELLATRYRTLFENALNAPSPQLAVADLRMPIVPDGTRGNELKENDGSYDTLSSFAAAWTADLICATVA